MSDSWGKAGRLPGKIFRPWVTRLHSPSTRKEKSLHVRRPKASSPRLLVTSRCAAQRCNGALGNAKKKKDASEVEHPSNASLTLLSSLLCPPSDSVLFVSPAPTTQTKSGDDSFRWLCFFYRPNRWCFALPPASPEAPQLYTCNSLSFQLFFSLLFQPLTWLNLLHHQQLLASLCKAAAPASQYVCAHQGDQLRTKRI